MEIWLKVKKKGDKILVHMLWEKPEKNAKKKTDFLNLYKYNMIMRKKNSIIYLELPMIP